MPFNLILKAMNEILHLQRSEGVEFSLEEEHVSLISLNEDFAYYEYDPEFDFTPTDNTLKKEFNLNYDGEIVHFERIEASKGKADTPTEETN